MATPSLSQTVQVSSCNTLYFHDQATVNQHARNAIPAHEKQDSIIKGMAQFVFKNVGISSTLKDREIVKLPIHAATHTKALMVMQAFSKRCSEMTTEQFASETANLQKARVVFGQVDKKGSYDISFYYDDEVTGHSKNIVKVNMTKEEQKQVENLAEALEQADPSLRIQAPPAVVSSDLEAEVQLTRTPLTRASFDSLKKDGAHFKVLQDFSRPSVAATQPGEQEPLLKVKEAVKQYNQIFKDNWTTIADDTFATPKDFHKKIYADAYVAVNPESLSVPVPAQTSYLKAFEHLVNSAIAKLPSV